MENRETGNQPKAARHTAATFRASVEVASDAILRELVPVVVEPTGRSSAGYPYLSRSAWARFRDWVPHTLWAGQRTWLALDQVEDALGDEVADSTRVVRQVLRTAAITAPPDLWLLRHVISSLAVTGWRAKLAEGVLAVPDALEPDVTLLLSRGYLVRMGRGYRWDEGPSAQRVLHDLAPLPPRPADLSRRWARAFSGDRTDDAVLADVLGTGIDARSVHPPPAWVATPEDIELGYRLVPMVLGMRAAGVLELLLQEERLEEGVLGRLPLPLAASVVATLAAAGWCTDEGVLTAIGARGFGRGPGPFGIIEAYHPYMGVLPRIWAKGRGAVHVSRAANVAASQDANRATFARANDALDRFCTDTGFTYRVFIEHAVGRGEALRQRYLRSGDATAYVGADLEEAAIASAREEVAAGNLPANVTFVHADIAEPRILVDALKAAGLDPEGAVMLVGNGLHEVRDQSDARMVAVFEGYERAGIILLFTEESALSVDDLLKTAWNTYHAGFRYVHARSGQGLRPAAPGPPSGIGPPLPVSWFECAARAGYVRADAYSSRSRTIYPYPPTNGHNPSVSHNQFFVPARLAVRYLPVARNTPSGNSA